MAGWLGGAGCEQRGQALSPNPAGAWWHLARRVLGPGEPQEGIPGAGMGWREDPQPGSQAGDLGSRENAAGEAAGSCCTSPLKCGWGFLGVPTGLLPHTQRDTSHRAGGCLCNTRSAEGLSCWPPHPAQCPHQVTGGLPHGSHPAPWRSPYPCAALAGQQRVALGDGSWSLFLPGQWGPDVAPVPGADTAPCARCAALPHSWPCCRGDGTVPPATGDRSWGQTDTP